MPAVFVHGVPDTAALWAPVVERLNRTDVVSARLPGFGAAVPDGFASTKDDYASWLAAELAAQNEPVDLVGHDWGSLLAQRVATTRPELVRTCVLANGAVSERFGWHELARQWQTPELGEQLAAAMTADAIAAALREARHPDPDGAARRVDQTMVTAVLALYRSAIDIASAWTPPPGATTKPMLVVWGRDDPYGPSAYGQAAADRAGAQFVELDAGHWSLVERPADAVALLESFWAES